MAKRPAQYVVSRNDDSGRRSNASASPVGMTRGGETSVAHMVDSVTGVHILGELDASTALVEMSEETRDLVERRYPELTVEPNLEYHHHARRRAG